MSIIYKIIDNTNNNVYYGSTKYKIEQRLKQHINAYNSYLKKNIRKCAVVNIIQNNDYRIELVEEVGEGIDPKDRERYYIENFDCINITIPNRKHKERVKLHYENNKEKYKENARLWRLNNKEKAKISSDKARKKYRDKMKNNNNNNTIEICHGGENSTVYSGLL
jgi:hypothetical protein